MIRLSGDRILFNDINPLLKRGDTGIILNLKIPFELHFCSGQKSFISSSIERGTVILYLAL